jgi:hypothetical protein
MLASAHADAGFVLVFLNGRCQTTPILLLAAETSDPGIPRLRADTVDVQASAGGRFTFEIYVLYNDIPSEELRLVTVKSQGARGLMSVDPTKKFLNYKLNTEGMWSGLSFTDRFRCACAMALDIAIRQHAAAAAAVEAVTSAPAANRG